MWLKYESSSLRRAERAFADVLCTRMASPVRLIYEHRSRHQHNEFDL
jgi:hypothetical protein